MNTKRGTAFSGGSTPDGTNELVSSDGQLSHPDAGSNTRPRSSALWSHTLMTQEGLSRKQPETHNVTGDSAIALTWGPEVCSPHRGGELPVVPARRFRSSLGCVSRGTGPLQSRLQDTTYAGCPWGTGWE